MSNLGPYRGGGWQRCRVLPDKSQLIDGWESLADDDTACVIGGYEDRIE